MVQQSKGVPSKHCGNEPVVANGNGPVQFCTAAFDWTNIGLPLPGQNRPSMGQFSFK